MKKQLKRFLCLFFATILNVMAQSETGRAVLEGTVTDPTGKAIAAADVIRFTRPSHHRQAWWFAHMGGMLGSYVATVSAFSAVNFTFLPLAVRFLWPSLVGIPLIFIWISYYRARFSGRTVAVVAA